MKRKEKKAKKPKKDNLIISFEKEDRIFELLIPKQMIDKITPKILYRFFEVSTKEPIDYSAKKRQVISLAKNL